MRKAFCYALGVAAFIAYYFSTSAAYIADTVRYSNDAVGHALGRNSQFWEFGHLLWRPWAYVGYLLFAPRYGQWFGDTSVQAVARFLIQTNFVCSFILLALLFLVVRKVASVSVAVIVICAVSCSTAFIDYSHSGAPYLPALLFSTLAFYWLLLAAESPASGSRLALGAGVAFGIACALWMPYAFTGLGMLAIIWFWPSNESNGAVPFRYRSLRLFLVSLAASALVLFLSGAAAKGVTNFSEFAKWMREADNELQQSANAMRAITGLPRSLWNLGTDTVYLKRWVFHDPFNPVKIYQMWAFRLAIKLATFYLGLAATAWVLWKERRPVLFMLLAAGVPLLLFAIFLFEPSATERFLPVFAFAFLGFAVVISTARSHWLAFACVAALLGSMAVYNLAGSWRPLANARVLNATRRIEALNGSVKPGAMVFVVTFNDDLYRLPLQNPLEKRLVFSRFRIVDAVFLSLERTPFWKNDLAQRTLDQWGSHGEVWVSERCLAARPESGWQWVEGDDRRVHWNDIPATFTPLQYDESVAAGSDGFLRLAQTPENEARLRGQLTPP